MNICVIRHGETDWNALGKLQGREDIPLNENGKLQARDCGLALSGRGFKAKAIFTSPLLRAKQTAEIIAEVLRVHEVYIETDLTERDFGKGSGMMMSERADIFKDGKYEGMEEWEPLRDRVCGAVLSAAAKFEPEDIIVVSHGAAINSILAELSDRAIGSGKTRLKNACINMLEYNNKSLKIVFFNKSYDEI